MSLSDQLISKSYAVLPGLYDEAWMARARASLERIYRDSGSPTPYRAEGVEWLGENIEISATGFVVHRLLGFAPELHHGALIPEAVDVVRGALGDDMTLEFVGGVVTNHERAFFKWHHHVGGIDDDAYRRLGWRPAIDRAERVAMLVYLDPMGPEAGQLLIHPHRVNGAADPPFAVDAEHWQGELAVEAPAGTVVLMDQCTWHAALPARNESLRMFVGFWFAAATVPKSLRVDETLFELSSPDPLLASLLPRRSDV